MSQYL
jgi:hypothetical protein